jgi:2-C-methyl-D-erythritol 2,4-cyclodiphosphate synthase
VLRIGHGFDVHQFAEGRRCVLGGVEVPYELGLLGHSDADVVTHALMDAILGALRAGDIGQLFPDDDPAFEGADSLVLLSRVMDVVRSRGARVLDCDCTIAAQAPKLAPYREQMRERLAGAMGLPVGSVGMKATTTEGLGFVGRKEGIAAWAVVLLDDGAPGDGRCSGR